MKKFKLFLFVFTVFIWGGYLASMFILQIHSNFEDRLFKRISTRIVGDFLKVDLKSKNPHIKHMISNSMNNNLTDRQKIEKLNEFVHIVLGPPRKILFLPSSELEKGIVDKYLHSSMISLLGGYACYMHSQVLGRLSKSIGINYRNFSMYNNLKNHNVAEIKIDRNWVIFDPLFNQKFVNRQNDLVGKEEINNNFLYYSKQIGNACRFKRGDYVYDMDYNYNFSRITKTFKSRINLSILYLWTKILNYSEVDELKVDILLNKYFYWELMLSTLFIIWNSIYVVFLLTTRRLTNEKI